MAMSKWIPETDPMILRRVGKTSEEAAELVKVCSRITIQGIAGVDPASGVANREALTQEIADVMAQCNVCIDTLALDRDAIRRRVREKVEQMREWEAMFSSHAV
ncbi:MAG: nucleoside triphosphate pyrophosphohydrolase family protein [Candidatus Nanopelagicales bacterium]